MITDEMVERAARALFDESPDMLDAGWEASPEKDIYRKAATAALSAAEQEPERVEITDEMCGRLAIYEFGEPEGNMYWAKCALSAALSSEAQKDRP